MSTRLFSSLVLREIVKEIEQVGKGIKPHSEKWARKMVKKHGKELEEEPVVYLTERENYQARQYLIFYKKADLNLAERATHFIRGKHAAEIKKYLTVRHHGWPILADHESMEEDRYPFPRDGGAPTCFKEWFAVTTVWRLTLAMPEVSFRDATIGTADSRISPLPELWQEKLDECLNFTEPSAILPAPRGWSLPLRRRDIDSVLPSSDLDTNETGLLTEGIIGSWFQILLSRQEQTKPDTTVVILPDSLDLAGKTPQEAAKNVMMVNESLDIILFPTIIKEVDHCVLVVAYPQKNVLAVYDSLGHESTKRLQEYRPWIKELYTPKDDDWEVMWIECPHQRAEVACGVFMLINALFAVNIKDTAKGYTHGDSMFLRRYVAAVICMGKLPEKF